MVVESARDEQSYKHDDIETECQKPPRSPSFLFSATNVTTTVVFSPKLMCHAKSVKETIIVPSRHFSRLRLSNRLQEGLALVERVAF